MNPQVVQEYLVSPEAMEELYPLGHPDTVVYVWTVQKLHTHRELLLLPGPGLVEYYLEVVGGVLAGLLHQGHGGGDLGLVGLWQWTGQQEGLE